MTATNTQKLLLLPGDGIGPEVTEEARRVAVHVAPDLEIDSAFFGGISYDNFGVPLTDEVMERARKSDAILMGAVGGPKWDNVPRDKRPEAALLSMRKNLDVYANLRPAFCFPALAGASALKTELVEGLDILIVRELTSGVYFGQPKMIEDLPNGERRGVDTQSYTTSEIRRVAARAFELARGRTGRTGKFPGVLSCEKSNVMDSGLLWRQEVI
ncbi:MAG TPA: isocitrate/isopropylmalate family dehydrogenase, partial [Hyphomonadaceae bacterium]|nr:isocitrate/isopropylmalate family dehydrogenase [Hyphomonadaceae bacterium]